jgi:L-threonylcarbamoyladenylate synthase
MNEPHMSDEADIQRAAELIRAGKVVAFPTETVYGLGADALNPQAVARIFEIKARPRFDPLIVHIASRSQALDLAAEFGPIASRLAEIFWPGPLTLVLQRRPIVPDIVTSGLDTVAIRMPDHPIALKLLREAATPIAAPSANRFGRLSPTTAAHVQSELGSEPDMILDGGPCTTGVESTILSLVDHPTLLRPGGVPIELLEAVTGPVRLATTAQKRPAAPGQLPHHYAPRTPLFLHDGDFWKHPDATPPTPAAASADPAESTPRHTRGLLLLRPPTEPTGYGHVEVLSSAGELREAATNLFAAMHRLDAAGLTAIDAQRVQNRGLGMAINDRLMRAAAGSTGQSQ